MTTPIPIDVRPLPKRPRLATNTTRPDCRTSNLKLLVRLHSRMQRMMLAYANVSEAIVRQIGAA